MNPAPCIVFCEGRVSDAIGVKLLLASALRHAPDWDVLAYISQPMLSAVQKDLHAIHPRVRLIPYTGPENWSCKPAVLLSALDDAPGRRLLWLDVDILLAGDLAPITAVDPQTLVIAEESNPNDNGGIAQRQRAMGLDPAPPRETTVSSCVIGVTDSHRHLLTRWQTLMNQETFVREQALPPRERKLFFGDQEVWELVLCEPANRTVPLYWLTNDAQMVQGTYTAYTRPAMPLRDHAMFIHATGNLKPWRSGAARFGQEMFPYFWRARPYLSALSESERDHFRQRSRLAWLWRHVGGGFTTYRAARRLMKKFRP